VVLERGNVPGDEFHSNHGPRDAGLPELTDPWAECLQGLFRECLAGPSGELDGGTSVMRKSSDSSRMSMKSQRLPKSSTFFIHFKSMKSPSVLAVVMKETQPELWFSPEGRREKRWRKYATDDLMPIHASQA
jgi:hypothetical protein